MIFTIDRLQFINNSLIVFEFIDISDKNYYTQESNYIFLKHKIKALEERFSPNFYLIQYNEIKDLYNIKNNGKEFSLNKKEFTSWFKQLNSKSNLKNNSYSKKLGVATNHTEDPYIHQILKLIYQEDSSYPNLDLTNDDNGIKLVKKILNNDSTYGFDFDLYEPSQGIVLEFLKRENINVTNLTAHPNRYLENYKKFESLWNASRIATLSDFPNLFLVNYSEDDNEPINLINVIDFNPNASTSEIGINSDISYKFSHFKQFVEWIKMLNINPTEALESLSLLPKEIRGYDFWKDFNYMKKRSIGSNFK